MLKIKLLFSYWKLFLISCLFVLISYKMYAELKGINFNYILKYCHEINIFKLILLIIFGILTLCILCLYDLILKNNLKINTSKKDILIFSYIINSFNNLLGLGGFIGAGARILFYSSFFKNKQLLVKYISLMLVSMLSGLSLLSYVVLIYFKNIQQVGIFSNNWSILLILASNFFLPIFLIFSILRPIEKKNRFLSIKFTVISAIEFTCTSILFYCILITLQVDINFIDSSVIFIAAAIAGLISFIPGGLGAFDFIVIISLTSFGVSKEVSTLSIIIYRIIYYFIPIILSILLSTLFIKNKGFVTR